MSKKNPKSTWQEQLNDIEELPLVTIAIPTLNEEDYITMCLKSIKNQTWPLEKMEVLVIDAFSTDRTREKVKDFEAHSGLNLRLIDNPGKLQAKAMNLAIKIAHGKIFVRMDAHSIYNQKYVETAVRILTQRKDVWNVGGYANILPATDSHKLFAIARAFANPFGSGYAAYRTTGPRTEKEVDTVFLGSYPVEIFKEIGNYNEELRVGEDIELNNRIQSHNKKILISPEMEIDYVLKTATFKDLWKRNIKYGTWLFRRKGGRSLRHFIPMAFLFFLVSGPVMFAINALLALPWSAGMLIYITTAVFFILRNEKPTPSLKRILLMILAFIIMHTGFGLGSFVSMLRYGWKSNASKPGL